MKSELAIELPSSVVTRNALLIDNRATDKQVGELGRLLSQIEGARSFWLGDYGLFIQARKLADIQKIEGKMNDEQLEAKGSHYIGEKAAILGIDEGSWNNYVSVCRFYKPSFRHETLSFSHHSAAIKGAGGVSGDAKKALEWLYKAEENDWSASELRHQINKSFSTESEPEREPLENEFHAIDEADGLALKKRDRNLTPDDARRLLTRWYELIAFIEKLKELAK